MESLYFVQIIYEMIINYLTKSNSMRTFPIIYVFYYDNEQGHFKIFTHVACTIRTAYKMTSNGIM